MGEVSSEAAVGENEPCTARGLCCEGEGWEMMSAVGADLRGAPFIWLFPCPVLWIMPTGLILVLSAPTSSVLCLDVEALPRQLPLHP